MKSDKTCPRCGLKYSYIERRKIGNKVYLYVVHYLRVGSERKIRKCYLSPSNDYVHFFKLHEFILKGLSGETFVSYEVLY